MTIWIGWAVVAPAIIALTRRFNSLHAVGALVDEDPARARAMLAELGDLLREVLRDDVRWIEAADNYVRFHTTSGVHLSRRRIRDLEQALDPARFARVHRSAIVNLQRVRELRPLGDGDQAILLDDGTRLTLTRSYRAAFEERFGGIA